MDITLIDSIDDLSATDWNRLADGSNPFLSHEFLAALEHHHAVGGNSGWLPRYLIASADGQLAGAVPMYLKHHSFGEFVFDWSWANAYARAGMQYYPKLVVAIPYTPVTGDRLLIAPEADKESVGNALIRQAIEQAESSGVSSLHWLFTNPSDTQRLQSHGMMLRTGNQFHWHNEVYRDFDDYLDSFTSRNRKKIKRERRRVIEQGLETRLIHGTSINDSEWHSFYHFYQSTFIKRGNFAPLSLGFFRELGETLGDKVFIIMARQQQQDVAGAIFLRGNDTLYGRYWGCLEDFHSLHFEVCYYRAIEYCIEQGLPRFEAGAQGEHKLIRGFRPTPTYSTHWIAHPEFKQAIENFLLYEQREMQNYAEELTNHLPYRSGSQ